MKRRYELAVGDSSSQSAYDAGLREDGLDIKVTRQVSKRRRVGGFGTRGGTNRLSTALQDINNLSHNSTVPPDDFTKPQKINSQPIKTTLPKRTPSLSRPTVPRPMSEPTSLSLHGSTSEHDAEPKNLHISPASPRRSLSGPAPSVQPNNSESIGFNSPRSRFISQDNPVRIKQLQGFRHVKSVDQNEELDSDPEDETEEDEVTDDDDTREPAEEAPEDSAEREVVETRYSDINK
ncbi:hypothetical protein FRC09_000133 [Ceratobasidium sp. 395]|nr:hypothetical protein FRC09_000133 [Ceratobasidium sp. 395]